MLARVGRHAEYGRAESMFPVRRVASTRFAEVAGILATFILYSSLCIYLFDTSLVWLKPLYVYLAFISAGVVIYVISGRRASKAIKEHHRLILALLLMVLIVSGQAAFFRLDDTQFAIYSGRLHFVFSTIAFLIIFNECHDLSRVASSLGLVVVLSSGMNVAEYFLGGQSFDWMSNVPGRAAGFYENPNDSATFISMAIPVVALRLSAAPRLALFVVSFAGVFLTFSRGGLMLWFAALVLTEFGRTSGRRGLNAQRIFVASTLFLFVFALAYFRTEVTQLVASNLWPFLDANTTARIELTNDIADDDRVQLAAFGLSAFASAPLFGNGIGYTHIWSHGASVHNEFVLLLAEHGLIGGLWIVAFIALMWQRGRPLGTSIAVLFLLAGFLSHNHLERPAVGMLIALYMVAASRAQRLQRGVAY